MAYLKFFLILLCFLSLPILILYLDERKQRESFKDDERVIENMKKREKELILKKKHN